jgi:hypothetical protein
VLESEVERVLCGVITKEAGERTQEGQHCAGDAKVS